MADQFPFTEGEEEFCRKFFENPAICINALNSSNIASRTQRNQKIYIRQEQYSKTLYCVSVSANPEGGNGLVGIIRNFLHVNNLVLLIIGRTYEDIVPGRMADRCTQVAEDNKRDWNETRAVFSLPIDFNEIRFISAVEKSVKEKLGLIIPKKIVDELRLTVATKFIITTRDRLQLVENRIRNVGDQVLTTLIMSNLTNEGEDAQLRRNIRTLWDELRAQNENIGELPIVQETEITNLEDNMENMNIHQT